MRRSWLALAIHIWINPLSTVPNGMAKLWVAGIVTDLQNLFLWHSVGNRPPFKRGNSGINSLPDKFLVWHGNFRTSTPLVVFFQDFYCFFGCHVFGYLRSDSP